ncbi:MAG TPA: adenylate/guanylate cyclase domain-containing protein [Saprospiraceae bacterium]|nr:adenylate/guanylate cyclase domain-containing protein [Saprospiraceae bacterium]
MENMNSPKELNMLKRIWSRYQTFGIDEFTPDQEVRYIQALNGMVLIVTGMLWLQLPFVIKLLPETRYILAAFIFWPLFAQGVPYLNHKRKYTSARLLYSLSTIILIAFVAIQLGPETENHLFMVAAVVGSFIIFPPKDRIWLMFVVVVTSVALISLESMYTLYGGILDFPPEAIKTARWSSMSAFFLIIIGITGYHYQIVNEAERLLELEHRRSEGLLLNILPKPIAERLKRHEKPIADKIEDASILFADLVGFTPLAQKISHERLVEILNELFSAFDHMVTQYRLEKIKTIGDSYMIAGGVTGATSDHHVAIAHCALKMIEKVRMMKLPEGIELGIRIGIHCGPVVAGVICEQKFAYDLWGDTVNMASRLESHGLTNQIQVSQEFFNKTSHAFHYQFNGQVNIKGKGEINSYLLGHPV